VLEIRPLVVVDPPEALVDQAGDIRLFLLAFAGLTLGTGNPPVGNDVLGLDTVEHITGGVQLTLTAGTEFGRKALFFNSRKYFRHLGKYDVFSNVMYLHNLISSLS
jgi:hypothetical protein